MAGLTTSLHLVSGAVCHTCSGSGAEPGTQPTPCPVCGGRGVVEDDQGFFATSPLPGLRRAGVRIEHPCSTCKGVAWSVAPET
ncbi:MAG: zinc finger domain-containing protein [Acidimicrobiales bacterium]